MGIPKLENPPVEDGNKDDEDPGYEVDEDAGRRPDRLTKLQTTRERRRGIKVLQVVPELTCKRCADKLEMPTYLNIVT